MQHLTAVYKGRFYSSSSVHRDLAWGLEGGQHGPQRGLIAGEVPVHRLGTAETPLSKVLNP